MGIGKSPLLSTLVAIVLCSSVSQAQSQTAPKPAAKPVVDPDSSHWGAEVTFSPQWQTLHFVEQLTKETLDIKGSEFKVGIVRGRDLSGDWGVEYIRKTINDGSRVDETHSSTCINSTCVSTGRFYFTRNVTLSGLEVYKFIPFGTIKRRVQIGVNVAGGVGTFNGQVETHKIDPVFSFNPQTRQSTITTTETVTTDSAKNLIKFSPFPTGKAEIAVAVIAAPGFKIRASGGLNFPGSQRFALTAIYFFGRH